MADDRKLGLYHKYHVERVYDPTGKHENCEFFVLDLNHDKHAIAALKAYAISCQDEYPKLAVDLLVKTRVMEEKQHG